MESQPENPEIGNNLENFNPCIYIIQGSYRQNSKTFQGLLKDFSTVFKTENLRKILIYMLKFYF